MCVQFVVRLMVVQVALEIRTLGAVVYLQTRSMTHVHIQVCTCIGTVDGCLPAIQQSTVSSAVNRPRVGTQPSVLYRPSPVVCEGGQLEWSIHAQLKCEHKQEGLELKLGRTLMFRMGK